MTRPADALRCESLAARTVRTACSPATLDLRGEVLGNLAEQRMAGKRSDPSGVRKRWGILKKVPRGHDAGSEGQTISASLNFPSGYEQGSGPTSPSRTLTACGV